MCQTTHHVSSDTYINLHLTAVNTVVYYLYMKKTVCPICNGSGKTDAPFHADTSAEAKQIMARALSAKGYSMRQIAKLCGWKSVASVQKALA